MVSTPELCYTGTEDIVPKDAFKVIKAKRRPAKKKLSNTSKKGKLESLDTAVPVKKKKKSNVKNIVKTSDGADMVNGCVAGEEATSVTAEVVKKKKVKKERITETLPNGEAIGNAEENCAPQKKVTKTKKTLKVKKEMKENAVNIDPNGKLKSGSKQRKRKMNNENTEKDVLCDSKAKKKTVGKKKSDEEGRVVKKGKVATDSGSDNADNGPAELLAVSANKKATAGALALQATVEKLQGRLTPTPIPTNSSNGDCAELLQPIGPNIESSKCMETDKDLTRSQSYPRPSQESDLDRTINAVAKGYTDTYPLNLSSVKSTTRENNLSTENPAAFATLNSSPPSVALDLSNKKDNTLAVISKDGSLDLSAKDPLLKLSQKEQTVQPCADRTGAVLSSIAQLRNIEETVSKTANRPEAEHVEAAADLDKKRKGPQNNGTDPNNAKPQNLSKAVKKERVESAIEKLFLKRDTSVASSGVKKQRVEKTINMLLAKKEKHVGQTDKNTAHSENLQQQKSTSDSSKTDRS